MTTLTVRVDEKGSNLASGVYLFPLHDPPIPTGRDGQAGRLVATKKSVLTR
ncbi:MAG: hypothetical protein AAB209_07930 [Bacteroidota bacterium]